MCAKIFLMCFVCGKQKDEATLKWKLILPLSLSLSLSLSPFLLSLLWGSNFGVLGGVEYSITDITPRSTPTRNGSSC